MFRVIFLVFVGLGLAACSAVPADDNAKAAVQSRIASNVQNAPFEMVRFEKTNGQSFDVNGIKGYKYFFSADVKFPKGYRSECAGDDGRFKGFNCAFSFGARQTIVAPQSVGAQVTYLGTILFENSENGWLAGAVDLKQQTVSQAENLENEVTSDDPRSIHAEKWGNGGGSFLLFDTPSAKDKKSTTDLVYSWGRLIEDAGAKSYAIEYRAPSYILLCIQSNNYINVKSMLLNNTPSAENIRVIEEGVFPGPKCKRSDE